MARHAISAAPPSRPLPAHWAEVRAVIDNGEDALRAHVERWGLDTRAVLARVLAAECPSTS